MTNNDYPTARPFLPDERDLKSLAEASQGCKGCPLYEDANQTVFGIGPADARLMLVGEQPGTKEDRMGEPFVGPAGRILDRVLMEVGLKRDEIYLTNAVKHFKSEKTEGRRAGIKPNMGEIKACRPWLSEEIAAVQPDLIVALGAVAARSLTGKVLAIGEVRGSWLETSEGQSLVVTYHPSAVIRAPAAINQDRIFESLVQDLDRAREALLSTRPGQQPRL